MRANCRSRLQVLQHTRALSVSNVRSAQRSSICAICARNKAGAGGRAATTTRSSCLLNGRTCSAADMAGWATNWEHH